jgi:hypothetical protein
MNRRMRGVLIGALLVGGLAVATVVVLTVALARGQDRHGYCETGFSRLSSCTLQWSSITTEQSSPIFTTPASATSTTSPASRDTSQPRYVDTTSWAVAKCPQNDIAKRLLCAAPSAMAPAQAASDDLASGLPRPKPWLLTTGKNSPFIESVHVETPLGLAAALNFYRVELGKRGWTENGGAAIAPDQAAITFTTSGGPALLRLIHQDDRTIADLSLRKPATANAGILSKPGQVKLLLGNATDEETDITITEQTIKLAARA